MTQFMFIRRTTHTHTQYTHRIHIQTGRLTLNNSRREYTIRLHNFQPPKPPALYRQFDSSWAVWVECIRIAIAATRPETTTLDSSLCSQHSLISSSLFQILAFHHCQSLLMVMVSGLFGRRQCFFIHHCRPNIVFGSEVKRSLSRVALGHGACYMGGGMIQSHHLSNTCIVWTDASGENKRYELNRKHNSHGNVRMLHDCVVST